MQKQISIIGWSCFLTSDVYPHIQCIRLNTEQGVQLTVQGADFVHGLSSCAGYGELDTGCMQLNRPKGWFCAWFILLCRI
jgi:hypothetical protein